MRQMATLHEMYIHTMHMLVHDCVYYKCTCVYNIYMRSHHKVLLEQMEQLFVYHML